MVKREREREREMCVEGCNSTMHNQDCIVWYDYCKTLVCCQKYFSLDMIIVLMDYHMPALIIKQINDVLIAFGQEKDRDYVLFLPKFCVPMIIDLLTTSGKENG